MDDVARLGTGTFKVSLNVGMPSQSHAIADGACHVWMRRRIWSLPSTKLACDQCLTPNSQSSSQCGPIEDSCGGLATVWCSLVECSC